MHRKELDMCGPFPSNLGSSLQSLYLYFENIKNDFKAVQAGNDIRYHKEKKKNRKRKKKKGKALKSLKKSLQTRL